MNNFTDPFGRGTWASPLDYNDPSLDFFKAKAVIIDWLRTEKGVTDEAFENSLILDMIDNWAYAADLAASRSNAAHAVTV